MVLWGRLWARALEDLGQAWEGKPPPQSIPDSYGDPRTPTGDVLKPPTLSPPEASRLSRS